MLGVFYSTPRIFIYVKVKTIINRYNMNMLQWLRKVCSMKLVNTSIILGGSGVVVQIDESLFHEILS